MSTFSRKSLIWWNYDNHSQEYALRYAHTPKDIQLKILQKWYPIGTKINEYNILSKSFSKTIYEITNHVETTWGWAIQYENNSVIRNWHDRPVNPVMCFVVEEDRKSIKRQNKLNKIL